MWLPCHQNSINPYVKSIVKITGGTFGSPRGNLWSAQVDTVEVDTEDETDVGTMSSASTPCRPERRRKASQASPSRWYGRMVTSRSAEGICTSIAAPLHRMTIPSFIRAMATRIVRLIYDGTIARSMHDYTFVVPIHDSTISRHMIGSIIQSMMLRPFIRSASVGPCRPSTAVDPQLLFENTCPGAARGMRHHGSRPHAAPRRDPPASPRPECSHTKKSCRHPEYRGIRAPPSGLPDGITWS